MEPLFTLYFACKEFDIAKIEMSWLSRIKIWGAHFIRESSIFSIMTGWIAKVLSFLCCSLLIVLCNELNKAILAYRLFANP